MPVTLVFGETVTAVLGFVSSPETVLYKSLGDNKPIFSGFKAKTAVT